MTRRLLIAALLLSFPAHAAIFLGGQRVVFDKNGQPQFTRRQRDGSTPATRLGLAQWAATYDGRRLVKRFDSDEYEITVTEDPNESGYGRSPEPGFVMLLNAGNPKVKKVYELILNPRFEVPERTTVLAGEPATPAEMMAAAWAAEMLHIDFYSRGIGLPHHSRDDFQSQWAMVASQLGWPTMPHGEDSSATAGFRRLR